MKFVAADGREVEVVGRPALAKEESDAFADLVRKSLVVRLRRRGYPYRVVAKVLNVSLARVHQIDKRVSDEDRRTLETMEF